MSIRIDESIIRTSKEAKTYTHSLPYTVFPAHCVDATNIRHLYGIPIKVEFRVANAPNTEHLRIYVRIQDWQQLQRKILKNKTAIRKQRIRDILAYSPIWLTVIALTSCLVGLTGAFIYISIRALCNRSFHFLPACYWSTGIVGTVLLLLYCYFALSVIFQSQRIRYGNCGCNSNSTPY